VRIYARLREPDLRHGLVSLLLAAFDAEPGEVWLISPWLRDVELPAAQLGHFSSVFAGHRDAVTLRELLGRVASRHRLTIVTKPPAELVPLREVRTLQELLRSRAAIVAEEAIRDYDAVDRAIAALTRQAEAVAAAVLQHAPTLELAWSLQERGAEIRFLDRLHAKLLWTPAGSLLGSANFTAGGFGRNEELMVEVTTPADHRHLGEVARGFAGRATPATAYSLWSALRRSHVSPAELESWSEGLFREHHPGVYELLRHLLTFIR
jgi:phosphatidylserine/phosphatidylglycerophosphate/cardiolipin synthase-like enzyme